LSTLLLFALALGVPVCGFAAKAEPGPLQADADSAVLNGDAEHYTALGIQRVRGVMIISLDGKDQNRGFLSVKYPTSIRMTPGRHRIRLSYSDDYYADLWLDAEAGKAYAGRGQVLADRTARLWIEEADTHRVVGGIGNGEDVPRDATTDAPVDASPALPVADATSALLVNHPGERGGGLLADPKARLKVVLVDGVKQFHMGAGDQVLKLAPRRHEIVVLYTSEGGGAYIERTLAFTAEAGHTYELKKQLDGYSARFWIEDPASGQAVSEEK
jgi:hypothetical protein